LGELLTFVGRRNSGDGADAVAREDVFETKRFGLAEDMEFGFLIGD
jgi:hypothetical protein